MFNKILLTTTVFSLTTLCFAMDAENSALSELQVVPRPVYGPVTLEEVSALRIFNNKKSPDVFLKQLNDKCSRAGEGHSWRKRILDPDINEIGHLALNLASFSDYVQNEDFIGNLIATIRSIKDDRVRFVNLAKNFIALLDAVRRYGGIDLGDIHEIVRGICGSNDYSATEEAISLAKELVTPDKHRLIGGIIGDIAFINVSSGLDG